MRFWTAIILALLAVTSASAQIHSVTVFGPRPYGFFIGDMIGHEVEIATDPALHILPGSLPEPGPLAYWLDLRKVELEDLGVHDGVRRHRLRLDYQTFYAPLQPRAMEIPGLAVTLVDGEARAEAVVPAWAFLMSPLREVIPSPGGGGISLRPDVPPPLIDLANTRRLVVAAAIATALLSVLIAWHRAWWPFHVRPTRSFARAARAARKELRGGGNAASYRGALLALHRAFDATAGRRVLADDLPSFLDNAPSFRATEPEIGRFFMASRRAFFGSDTEGAMTLLPGAALLELSRRLAAAERAAG